MGKEDNHNNLYTPKNYKEGEPPCPDCKHLSASGNFCLLGKHKEPDCPFFEPYIPEEEES